MSAAAFRARLIAAGIARPQDIMGCTAQEVAALEARFGRFPQSYRDMLLLCGKGAGALVDDREVFLFADQLERINADGWEALRLYREDGYAPDVPEGAVFVADRYGEHPQFILTGERADSPVSMFNTDLGAVTQVAGSVWEWMESFAAGAAYFLGRGLGGRNARRGPG